MKTVTMGIMFSLLSILRVWTKEHATTFYQLTIYHFASEAQEKSLDQYFQNALLPALKRMKIGSVGVFKSHANDTVAEKLAYTLIPLRSLAIADQLFDNLNKDQEYKSAAKDYLDATYNSPPFLRKETVLLRAFPMAPKLELPDLHASRKERVYELRSYESPTEEKFKNKVHMFNEGGEVELFRKLGFNAIFYAEVIAGSHMPNLMYMTSFENKGDRDAHWKTFVDDPFWKKLSALPEYQNNVSHIDISFLYPTEYSDF